MTTLVAMVMRIHTSYAALLSGHRGISHESLVLSGIQVTSGYSTVIPRESVV